MSQIDQIGKQVKFEEETYKFSKRGFCGKNHESTTNKVIVKDRLLDVAEDLADTSVNLEGTIGRYNKIFADTVVDNDFITVAYIGLSVVFESVSMGTASLTQVIMKIGQQIEDNYRFMLFETENKKVIELVKEDLNKRRSKQYHHRRRVLADKMSKYCDWEPWDNRIVAHMGTIVLDAIMNNYSDLLEIKDVKRGVVSMNMLIPTPKFCDWKNEYVSSMARYHIESYPMMIEPLNWEHEFRGGWYSERLKIGIVKTHSKEHKEKINVPEIVKKALNYQQSTAYTINKKMLEIVKDLINTNSISEMSKFYVGVLEDYPSHFNQDTKKMLPEEQEEFVKWKRRRAGVYTTRVKVNSRILWMSRTIRKATDLKDWDKLHFVFTCDFVGRMYPNSVFLSPQGSDLEKSLLDFKNEVNVSERGKVWIKVHTAKCYGIKGSEKELVKWYNTNISMIESIKNDWNDLRWTLAKKPFCFLRACQEDFKTSNLPIGVDGVCNGLQHYAGLFRDEVTAKNLGMTGDARADVYTLILDKCMTELKKVKSIVSYLWQGKNLNRDFFKPLVMLLSYGITKQSLSRKIFVQSLTEVLISYDNCAFLSDVIWKLFEQELKCVIKGMGILKEKVGKDFMTWESPSGFVIFQPYYKKVVMYVNLKVQRKIKISLKTETKECNSRKQRQAFPANYIHGNDAAHAVNIIVSMGTDIRAVHDEFAVHCNKVDKLQIVIKDTFVRMYENVESEHLGTLKLSDINHKNFFY